MGKGGGRGKGVGRTPLYDRKSRQEPVVQEVHKPAMAPPARSSLLWRNKGKFALASGGAAAGTAYAWHRTHPKTDQNTDSRRARVMKIYNPYTGDMVEVGKAYGNGTRLLQAKRSGKAGRVHERGATKVTKFASHAFANQPVSRVTALVPTGRNVSHANDLKVYRGKNLSVKTKSAVSHTRKGR
jgi:hypothetical protein